uniref:Uncharacterized protein n=1 Tax=Chromera velia CCMP2878 TaxID=1169474 RepID=A0A0G4FY54_9ALVE|eukprot:Cvel_19356.t1-p1 / transcript=Cvel_19356.t1 / gene=Cvel_19356 / organism=Chromera_velia_CCMP2878 / gene_product=hypothetical protein / transcript_product=hypothetical protein / location=Cvel_scaffold1662:37536-38558(+) / protein_length=341 / sequence_SO=supercontig / SO=protein_coding / is_pseudo=false
MAQTCASCRRLEASLLRETEALNSKLREGDQTIAALRNEVRQLKDKKVRERAGEQTVMESQFKLLKRELEETKKELEDVRVYKAEYHKMENEFKVRIGGAMKRIRELRDERDETERTRAELSEEVFDLRSERGAIGVEVLKERQKALWVERILLEKLRSLASENKILQRRLEGLVDGGGGGEVSDSLPPPCAGAGAHAASDVEGAAEYVSGEKREGERGLREPSRKGKRESPSPSLQTTVSSSSRREPGGERAGEGEAGDDKGAGWDEGYEERPSKVQKGMVPLGLSPLADGGDEEEAAASQWKFLEDEEEGASQKSTAAVSPSPCMSFSFEEGGQSDGII